MAIDSLETLRRAVVASSKASDWTTAVDEWEVVDLEEDPAGEGVCICGQTELVKLFTIRNRLNGSDLYPIGSVCVNKFGRKELDRQVELFSDLHTLRKALLAGREVELTSEYFSRAMIDYWYDNGVFTPDQYNSGNGEGDRAFLTKMFNKRNKDSITTRQEQKIYMLLRHKVFPYVVADSRPI